MEDIQLYSDYVNGILNSEKETEFYARLSIDADFRKEFKSFLFFTNKMIKYLIFSK